MKAFKTPKLSIQAYLEQELESGMKYEFHNGEIFAQAGGTINHGILSGNIYAEIKIQLEDKDAACIPFNSDVKLFIRKTNSFVYPDTMVVCGEIEQADEHEHSIANPILIVEVLSKSTINYDRADKFHMYRTLNSFKEYVLIEQDRFVVDVHFKPENSDLWKITRYEGIDQLIKLESLGIEVEMKRLYMNVKFNP